MVNAQFDEVTVTTELTDPNGNTYTGTIGSDSSGGSAWNHSGAVSGQNDVAVYLTELADTGSITIDTYSGVRADITPLPSNTSLQLVTFDGSGSTTVRDTIQNFDGSTMRVTVDSDSSYTNSSGGSQYVGVIFTNNTNSTIDLFTSGGVSTS